MTMKALFVFAAATFVGIPMMTAAAKPPSAKEAMTFKHCLQMQPDQAFDNEDCRTVLGKHHVTKTDLAKMRACEAQTEATENADCREMAEKHPDLARGHGMDDAGKSNQ